MNEAEGKVYFIITVDPSKGKGCYQKSPESQAWRG